MLNPEHTLIAFAPAPLPPGPWLVFAPHADDETFGMGGSLLKAKAAGITTHVIVLTDGALGGDTADLVRVRQEEARAATDLLGVSSIDFWPEPDRGLALRADLIERVANAIAAIAPGAVFFPGPLELHPDHRMAAHLVWSALQAMRHQPPFPRTFAYEIGVQNPVNTLIDISVHKQKKDEAMAIYASQNSQNNYPDLVRALDKGRTFTLPAEILAAEGFYEFELADFASSLHAVTRAILDRYF
jgi:LmbE family N-acetylglucosaminyl deacetylase